jgi:hypothetical protein
MTADERSDLTVLAVQTLERLRRIAARLEAAGIPRSDVDREMRENISAANLAPAVRESLRLEMTSDEIRRWL